MEANSNSLSQLQCRRNNSQDPASLWNKLSVSQKFSAGSLSSFGYDLTYIRNNNNESLAILLCGDSVATVNNEGDISTSSNIILR